MAVLLILFEVNLTQASAKVARLDTDPTLIILLLIFIAPAGVYILQDKINQRISAGGVQQPVYQQPSQQQQQPSVQSTTAQQPPNQQ